MGWMGWMGWDGMVISVWRSAKSTYGANKHKQIHFERLMSLIMSWCEFSKFSFIYHNIYRKCLGTWLSTLWWLLFSHQVLIHSKVYIVSIWILPLQGCTTSRPPELIKYFRPGARFSGLQCKNLLEHLCPAQRCFDMNLKWGQGPYYFKSQMN